MRRIVFAFVGVLLSANAHAGVWYYCDPLHVYYPYARTCPIPFRAVPFNPGHVTEKPKDPVPESKLDPVPEKPLDPAHQASAEQYKEGMKLAQDHYNEAARKWPEAVAESSHLAQQGLSQRSQDVIMAAQADWALAPKILEEEIMEAQQRKARRDEEITACQKGTITGCEHPLPNSDASANDAEWKCLELTQIVVGSAELSSKDHEYCAGFGRYMTSQGVRWPAGVKPVHEGMQPLIIGTVEFYLKKHPEAASECMAQITMESMAFLFSGGKE